MRIKLLLTQWKEYSIDIFSTKNIIVSKLKDEDIETKVRYNFRGSTFGIITWNVCFSYFTWGLGMLKSRLLFGSINIYVR